MRLGRAEADDDRVLVDDARGGHRDGGARGIHVEAFAEVDAASVAEALDRLAGLGVEFEEEVHDADNETSLASVLPEACAAHRLRPLDLRIEAPEELAGRAVERDDLLPEGDAEEHSSDDQRRVLQDALVAGVVAPGLTEVPGVMAIDLGERREVIAAHTSVDGPSLILCGGAGNHHRQYGQPRSESTHAHRPLDTAYALEARIASSRAARSWVMASPVG